MFRILCLEHCFTATISTLIVNQLEIVWCPKNGDDASVAIASVIVVVIIFDIVVCHQC